MTKHLLSIDDEDEIRDLLCEALSSSGHRVTGVGTLEEALQVVKTDPPDLVLTDLQLGESDGFDVVEQIKAISPSTPIIMLTGVIMDPAEIPAEVAGKIACYIPKTASMEEIMEKVEQHLSA